MTRRLALLVACAMALPACHTIEIVNAKRPKGDRYDEDAWDHTIFYGTVRTGTEMSIERFCGEDDWERLTINETVGTTMTTWFMHLVPAVALGIATKSIGGVFLGVMLVYPGAYNNVTLVYSPVDVEARCVTRQPQT